ncbi:RNA-guided endonuclease TnpB family protein [Thermostichus vulcanus]|uniref:Transposase n=1 Tax=Thermostichus vulcanus str. 'Rupite' TaxID=2813851 RepID=A0ABT0C906_THEVL|nr:RNA-guided endonuclease TnpB family protein [Thermostichus vulcanus]MCJ2542254.1 transposase [Thermostichus vulcanus str. 'Rupite']
MKRVTTTLKLKFLDLNAVKAEMFNQTVCATTALANELLRISPKERKALTTAKVVTPLKSALSNQVIRVLKGKAGQRVKHFKVFWPEVNNQNWKLHKVGSTYSVSFPTIQGDKRVPLEVSSSYYAERLERILAEQDCERGTLKLMKLRGCWYAVVSITWEVPEVKSTERLGVDRGQNRLAVAATRWGRAVFFGGGEVAYRRRRFQKRRAQLQQAGKYRALKRLERKEARWMRAVNHTVSRRIVRFAKAVNADVWMEDLSGIRQSRQSQKARSDAGKSRHTWSYYDLEWKVAYKLEMAGRTLHKRPAAYTSKTDHRTGLICSAGPEAIGKRSGHLFTGQDGYCCDADWNAAMNIAQWDGFACPLSLKEAVSVMGTVGSGDGVVGNPLNSMNPPQLQAVGS